MRKDRHWYRRFTFAGALVACAIGLGLTASSALAASQTFCVYKSIADCPAGSDTSHGDNLNAAIAHAESTADPDTIVVGTGTFDSDAHTSHGFFGTLTHQLTIRGAGQGATTLTSNGSDGHPVVTLSGPTGQVELSDLTIDGRHDMHGGFDPTDILAATGVNVHDVSVTGLTQGLDGRGISGSDLTLRHVSVSLTGNPLAYGAEIGGTNTVEDSTIQGPKVGLRTEGTTATVKRTTAIGEVALWHTAANGNITNSLLIARQSPGSAAGIFVRDSATTDGSLNATNVTVVNESPSPNSTGVQATPDKGHSALLNINASIVSGFPQQMLTDRHPLGASGTAPGAHVLGNYIAGAGTRDSLNGDVTDISGFGSSIPTDPAYIDPANGDYRLRVGTPAIDFYPGPVPADTDRNGDPRPVGDGDQNGQLDLDLGAFEYQRSAPHAVASADPSSAVAGHAIAFRSSGSSDPDGDSLTYAWSFDDGSAGTGPEVSHAFATAGTHSGTVTVTDPTGQTATAAATVVVRPAAVTPPPSKVEACEKAQTGTKRANVLNGTPLGDLLTGLGGNDTLNGKAGPDCLNGGRGNDRLRGGLGNDKLTGGPGNDNLDGGPGKDSVSGGSGRDTINSADGVKETIDCGSGRDSVRADKSDTLKHCEKVKRAKR